MVIFYALWILVMLVVYDDFYDIRDFLEDMEELRQRKKVHKEELRQIKRIHKEELRKMEEDC